MFITLISAQELHAHRNNANWIVFDCRHDLLKPDAGYQAYQQAHIPGAHFLHVDTDLSGIKTGLNGRHPLPERQRFAAVMAKHGVNINTQVVAYDASGGMFAARLWWMLRWLGHETVAVLDGGLPAWSAQGYKLDTTIAPSLSGHLVARDSLTASVEGNWVANQLGNPQYQIIDARAPERYRGEVEPIDAVAGHIPGALNRFYQLNLQADGRFKTPETLRAEYQSLIGARTPQQIIHQCGSGVTACHNLLAMEIAGLAGAALYAGSWSEWCVDPQRPVEKS